MSDSLQHFGSSQELMFHLPLYASETKNIVDAQRRLTDYCIKQLPSLGGKQVLDIGCGNGAQSAYIKQKYGAGQLFGLDIEEYSIKTAKENLQKLPGLQFSLGDAQDLKEFNDASMDTVLCIESAFHYSAKFAFLKSVRRVLKEGGDFLLADILYKNSSISTTWKSSWNKNHWTHEQYKEAFDKLGFCLVNEEDITDQIIKGIEQTKVLIKSPKKQKSFTSRLANYYVNNQFRHNAEQLKLNWNYHVFVLKKSDILPL